VTARSTPPKAPPATGPWTGLPPRRPRPRRALRVDLLPLIDVIFLLVAVLLLSMVRMVRSWTLPIDLPGATSGEELDAPTVLLLAIDRDGRYFAAGEPLELAELAQRVEHATAGDPELAVLVQADREARHGDVTALLDELRNAGAPRVLFVTAPAAAGDVQIGGSIEGSAPSTVPSGSDGG